jgi:DNA-binding transcriptional MerR regulator
MSVNTVKKVAKLSGVSVRALHHYDEIGLLKPACVGANGYRYYGRDELLRLQQILFHPELGFPLEQIRQVLSAPEFDRVAALRAHRERLKAEVRRYQRLVRTLDATLAALEGDMDDKAMYRGFASGRHRSSRCGGRARWSNRSAAAGIRANECDRGLPALGRAPVVIWTRIVVGITGAHALASVSRRA